MHPSASLGPVMDQLFHATLPFTGIPRSTSDRPRSLQMSQCHRRIDNPQIAGVESPLSENVVLHSHCSYRSVGEYPTPGAC